MKPINNDLQVPSPWEEDGQHPSSQSSDARESKETEVLHNVCSHACESEGEGLADLRRPTPDLLLFSRRQSLFLEVAG